MLLVPWMLCRLLCKDAGVRQTTGVAQQVNQDSYEIYEAMIVADPFAILCHPLPTVPASSFSDAKDPHLIESSSLSFQFFKVELVPEELQLLTYRVGGTEDAPLRDLT